MISGKSGVLFIKIDYKRITLVLQPGLFFTLCFKSALNPP